MRSARPALLPVVTSLLLALVVTGCGATGVPLGDGSGTATDSSTGTAATGATDTTAAGTGSPGRATAATPTTPTPTTTTAQQTNVLAWLPFGPATPQSPGAPVRVYATLFSDCARAVDLPLSEGMVGTEAAFYTSAALMCVGAQDGDEAAWSQGRTLWKEQGSGYPVETCFQQSVADAAAALAAAGPVPPTLGESQPGFACPPEQVDVEPRSGAAGSTVTVSWSTAVWLAEMMTVRIGGTEADWTFNEDASSAEYVVPEGPTGTVPVALDLGEFGTVPAGTFTYDDDQTSVDPGDRTQHDQRGGEPDDEPSDQPTDGTASSETGP